MLNRKPRRFFIYILGAMPQANILKPYRLICPYRIYCSERLQRSRMFIEKNSQSIIMHGAPPRSDITEHKRRSILCKRINHSHSDCATHLESYYLGSIYAINMRLRWSRSEHPPSIFLKVS